MLSKSINWHQYDCFIKLMDNKARWTTRLAYYINSRPITCYSRNRITFISGKYRKKFELSQNIFCRQTCRIFKSVTERSYRRQLFMKQIKSIPYIQRDIHYYVSALLKRWGRNASQSSPQLHRNLLHHLISVTSPYTSNNVDLFPSEGIYHRLVICTLLSSSRISEQTELNRKSI